MTFLDFFWSLIVFYFIFMLIWIFIRIFADIFRRRDLTAVWKVIWIIVLFWIPFFGAIVYMLTRPVTAQDLEEQAQAQQQQAAIAAQQAAQAQFVKQAAADSSTADQITKLVSLRDSGALTQEEYETAKAKALA